MTGLFVLHCSGGGLSRGADFEDDVFNSSGTAVVGEASVSRSRNGRRKSMVGRNVVYLVTSSDDDEDDVGDVDAEKKTKNSDTRPKGERGD